MILKFFLFITTILIVRSERLWTRLTSKPSLPSDLQDLLDSLYIRGYIPEYILPEDELTETEKTEGEYLDFPDLKNAQDDVFVPPESEYSKNNLHFKNIKVHKRLIPTNSGNPKTVDQWEELRSSDLSPKNMKIDFLSHLTENFRTNESSRLSNNSKLDFLIPIPERGTYPSDPTLINYPTEAISYVPYPVQPMYNFHLTSLSSDNKSTTQPSHYIFTYDTTKNYFSAKHPNMSTTTTKPPYHRAKPSSHILVAIQDASSQRIQQHLPGLTPLPVPVQNLPELAVKQHNNLDVKETPSIWTANIFQGNQYQSDKSIKNRTQRRPTNIPDMHRSTWGQKPYVIENPIQSKVVNQITNTAIINKEDKALIQTRVPFISENRNNFDMKMFSQGNSSNNCSGCQNHEVQVIENNAKSGADQPRGKKKMFTFLNIFKKNKKHPGDRDNTQSISIEEASSLSELYNQLKDAPNIINENHEFKKRYPIKQDLYYEEMLYHKRKK